MPYADKSLVCTMFGVFVLQAEKRCLLNMTPLAYIDQTLYA